eukprot:m.25231 g.25231  ORF g.25231 m.25231 type:complete len:316 (-) comp9717_c0_seq1:39-986(-)
MGEAADRVGVTFQACMSYVRHILQMMECPAMTNARASDDYHPGNEQWNIGTSSILAWATGIAPSKDNYWSTPDQPGNAKYIDSREIHNRLQALVSTLSTGPVMPSDKIGFSNVSLIMMSCAEDGALLQPDKPATSMDSMFTYKAFGTGVDGQLWSTYTALEFVYVSYVLAVNVSTPYLLLPHELGYNDQDQLLVFEANSTRTLRPFSSSSPITINPCDKLSFQFYTIVPVLSNGWALVGETSKWVSVSNTRLQDPVVSTLDLSVVIKGLAGEAVILWLRAPDSTLVSATCVVGSNGRVILWVDASTKGFQCKQDF